MMEQETTWNHDRHHFLKAENLLYKDISLTTMVSEHWTSTFEQPRRLLTMWQDVYQVYKGLYHWSGVPGPCRPNHACHPIQWM